MDFSRLKSLINPDEVELLFFNKKQNKMVEAFHKYNNVVDPETSLALVLDKTIYTLIKFQRGEGFTRANFDQQGVAIAAFYVLVMSKFQRQGIDQPIQNKIRNLAQTSSEINEVELEINKILAPDYFSLNSMKRAAMNLISGNNGYDVCYINDTGEKISITKGRKHHLAIVALLNFGFILQSFTGNILPVLLKEDKFSNTQIESFKRLYLGR